MRAAIISVLIGAVASVQPGWGYTNCDVSQIESQPSVLPMEGSDPVIVDSHVYMAYGTGEELVFLTSNNGGRSIAARQRLDNGSGVSARRPRIAANGPRVYVTWLTSNPQRATHVMFRKSEDNGASFDPTIVLGQAIAGDNPQIAASGLGVTVAYVDVAGRQTLVSSEDGGETWPYRKVIKIAAIAREETVGRLGQNIVLSWSERNKPVSYNYVGTSTDGGSYYLVRKLTPDSQGDKERQVAVSETTGHWFIYGLDESQGRHINGTGSGVLFSSADRGVSWTKQVLSENTLPGWILVDGSTIYISWVEKLRGGVHVELTYSLDDGQTWSAPSDLSGPTGIATPLVDESYRPLLSMRDKVFDEVYMSDDNVVVRSTSDIAAGMSAPIELGLGTNGVIAGGNVLWLGPRVGQKQAVLRAYCR